ncbi:hypothetical protein F5884DRAFT_858296 [Xylogone sp. PMI_703]|nr:hypothetical protein F5884DRAFT_858296 [Xylogone sp. PMI_703]
MSDSRPFYRDGKYYRDGSYYRDETEYHRRVQGDGYQRDPYPWHDDKKSDYYGYKAADKRHGDDQTTYITERDRRKAAVKTLSHRPEIYYPRGLSRQDHEELIPVASRWKDSATEHRDLRRDFDKKWPHAYSSTAAKMRHHEATDGADNSIGAAQEFLDEHLRYGGQFMASDPYDTYDKHTGGSHNPATGRPRESWGYPEY